MFFLKKRNKQRLHGESRLINKEINRSKRFGYQFGVLVVEVSHTVPRGLSRLLPGRTLSFHLLEKNIRQYDTVIRSVQRRYFVILPEADKNGVAAVNERILRIAREHNWGNVLIGAAVYPGDGENADSLLNKAVIRATG